MAYIEKEPIIEFITKGLNNPDKTKAFGHDAIEILTEIKYAPTADVVPKSEYDEVLSSWQKIHDSYTTDCVDHYNKGRTEAAREIFEEIEGSIAVHAFTSKSEDYADGMYDAIEWVDSKIAELKKKYTEDME